MKKEQLELELRAARKRIAELESASVSESEDRFASIFHASPAQMALTDMLTGKYVDVNEAFLRTLGFARDEIVGKTAVELNLFIRPEQRTELLQHMDSHGYLRNEHVLVRSKTGEIRHGIFSAEYIRANGQTFLLTIMNDVTEKLLAEERWHFALEGAGDGIWDWDVQTDKVFFSRQCKTMLGYEDNEIGDTLDEWSSRVHPDDLVAALQKVNQHLEGKTPAYASEHRMRCKDGAYKWILARGKLIEWAVDGKPLRVIGTHKDISEQKSAEEKLRESEARFARVFQANPASQLIVSLRDGNVVDANIAFCQQTGFELAEIVGRNTRELNLWADEAKQQEAIQQLQAGKHVYGLETDFRTRSGEIRTVLLSLDPVELNGVRCIVFTGIDITERKLAENALAASEKQLKSLIESQSHFVVRINMDGKYTYWNKQFEREFGWLYPQGLRNAHSLTAICEYHHEHVNKVVQKCIAEPSSVFSVELDKPAHDGGIRNTLWEFMCLTDEHNQPLEIQCMGIENTARKQAEQALRESEARAKAMLNAIPDMMFRSSRAGIFLDYRASASDLYYQNGTLVGQHIEDTLPLELAQQTKANIATALATNQLQTFEYQLDLPAGRHEFEARMVPSGPDEVISIVRDITERKLVEEALAAERSRFRKLMDNLPDAIYFKDAESRFTQINRAQAQRFGLSDPAQAIGKTDFDFFASGHAQLAFEDEQNIMRTGIPVVDKEEEETWANGRETWVTTTKLPLRDQEGRIIGTYGISYDITERKQAEEKLRASREQLNRVLKAARMGTWHRDISTNTMEMSPEFALIFGEETSTISIDDVQERIHPEDREWVDRAIQESIFQKKSINLEYRVFDTTGNMLWVTNFVYVDVDAQGNFVAITGLLQDITERKRAEEKLAESEARYRTLFEEMPMGVLLANQKGEILDVNPASLKILGSPSIDATKKINLLTFPPLIEAGIAADFQEAIIAGEIIRSERYYKSKWGKSIHLQITFVPTGETGENKGEYYFLLEDITARKEVEKELRLAELRYRALIENAPDGIMLVGEDGKFKYASPAARKLSGFSMTDIEYDLRSTIHPDDLQMVFEELVKVIQTPAYVPTLQHRMQNKDGEWHWIESTLSNLLRLPGVEAIIINFRDITERKLAEEELKRSQELLKEAQRIGRIGYLEWNIQSPALICSDEIYEIFDVPPSTSFTRDFINDLMGPGDRERLQELDHQAIRQRVDMNYEYTIHTRNGHERCLHQIGRITYGDNETPIRMMMIVQDITQRKLAEKALRASEEKYRGLMESLDNAVFTVDYEGRFLYLNDMGAEKLGGKPQDFIGKSMLEVFPAPLASFQLASVQRIFQDDQQVVFEGQSPGMNGLRWYRFSFQPLHDENGNVAQVLINATDIHDLKTTQQELEILNGTLEERVKERAAQVQDLYDNAPVGYHSLDAEGRLVAINQTELNWLGYTREELLGKSITSIYAHRTVEAFAKEFESFKVEGLTANVEAEVVRKDGTTFPIMINAIATYDENGQYLSSRSTMADITERKRVENELKRNVNFTTALLDAIPTPVFYKDRLGRYQGCNRAFTEIMGKTQEELRGKTVYELWPSEHAALYHQKDLEVMNNQKHQIYEATISDRDGKVRPVIFVKDIFHDESGNVAGLVGAFVDITAQKQTENALHERERNSQSLLRLSRQLEQAQSYSDVLNAARDEVRATIGYQNLWTYLVTEDQKFARLIMAGGPIEEKLQGIPLLPIQGDPLIEAIVNARDIIVVEDARTDERTDKKIAEMLGNRTIVNVPIVLSNRHLGSVGVGTFGDEGVLVPTESDREYLIALASHMAVTLDRVNLLNERKRAQDELLKLSRQDQAALSIARMGHWEFDPAMGQFIFNDQYYTLHGMSAEQAGGYLMPAETFAQKYVHPEDARMVADAIQHGLETDDPNFHYQLDGRILRADGEPRNVIVWFRVEKDAQGKTIKLHGVNQDITERKRAEDALRFANLELERAMRIKDEFLASMSHELRTPLNAVLGLSVSLLEQYIGPLNERQIQSVQTIESSGRHLLALINDILDLSKLEASLMTPELTSVSVQEVCNASLIFIKDSAHKKHIRVSSQLDPAVGYLQADERRLKQMLINLLINAVKFTPEGGSVELQVVGLLDEQAVSFSVIDTGIGIAPENFKRLFKPFVQLDSGLNRQYEGTGLGLSLVARMAELHGGSVSMESELGRGSRFSIVLPWLKAAPSPAAVEKLPEDMVSVKTANAFPAGSTPPLILIAEDNESNIITLSIFLQARGYHLAIARNGNEALEQARLKPPSLILMDLQMPVLDGLETIRRLRLESDPRVANIPVVALTALAMPADRERAFHAGANEYMSKPVNQKKLSEIINRLTGEE